MSAAAATVGGEETAAVMTRTHPADELVDLLAVDGVTGLRQGGE